MTTTETTKHPHAKALLDAFHKSVKELHEKLHELHADHTTAAQTRVQNAIRAHEKATTQFHDDVLGTTTDIRG